MQPTGHIDRPSEARVASTIRADSLAARYLERLAAHDHQAALALIRESLDANLSIRELYLDVIVPVQHQIGLLWERGEISVAQEHYCTAVSQLALAEAYPRFVRAHGSEWRAVTACIPGELHELGARMVADFFEVEGWDATFLGNVGDFDQIFRELVAADAQLLCLSVTMAFNVRAAAKLIDEMHARPTLSRIKVLLGGRALGPTGERFRELGADGYAADADAAVRLGEALVGRRTVTRTSD